ncbi:MAG: L-aspartate oxidase [Nitrospirota bacterium]|nr:MAG: L-aspartate oxidase [Nitrospirota bacterium]
MKVESTDFLIIGSGVAGLRAAIELAPHGQVVVVTKDQPGESSTRYAQGGVAAALSDEDEVGIHLNDTLKAGDGLCRRESVEVLVNEGPTRILELMEWGAEFDKEGSNLSFALEAAHSKKRVLRAHGDSTGKEIERVLVNKVRSLPTVSRYSFAYSPDLIVKDNTCYGAYIIKDRKTSAIVAKATLLATGGAGQIFARTTNPFVATGDGMAISYRAGAVLENMEMVQFHPTALYSPAAPQFLLSEAMRGEGALLRNINGQEFMKKYHPDGEMATRDVVSRAIVSEIFATKSDHVYLDLTHMDKEFIKNRFPAIYSTCLNYEFDITEQMVPVSPAAHYIIGGVKTNIDTLTEIRGLYVAGEAASTGVHGANRLASNSLLEGLVFGARAGESIIRNPLDDEEIKDAGLKVERESSGRSFSTIVQYDEIRSKLRKIMWDRAGIIRCDRSLKEALDAFEQWHWILDKEFMTRRELELKNMIQVGLIITTSAMERTCSVGAHFRSDYKEKDNCIYAIDVQKDRGITRELI